MSTTCPAAGHRYPSVRRFRERVVEYGGTVGRGKYFLSAAMGGSPFQFHVGRALQNRGLAGASIVYKDKKNHTR